MGKAVAEQPQVTQRHVQESERQPRFGRLSGGLPTFHARHREQWIFCRAPSALLSRASWRHRFLGNSSECESQSLRRDSALHRCRSLRALILESRAKRRDRLETSKSRLLVRTCAI